MIVAAASPRLSVLCGASLASASSPPVATKLAPMARRIMTRITTRLSSWRAARPPAYLSKKLMPPLPTKDGGMLRTIREACEYMAAIGKQRELRRHWQHVRKLILEEADVVAVSWQLRLAVLKDAKLDVAADQAIDKEAEAQARS